MKKSGRMTAPQSRPAPLTYFMPTAESLAALERQQLRDFSDFVEYWKRASHLPLEKAFKVWWVFRGPTGFYRTEDHDQYRKSLQVFVMSRINNILEVADVSEHTSQS